VGKYVLHHGDCLEVLRTFADCSVDAVVTDPPYGLAFMGKRWDYDVPSVDVWAECLRVLKPGGHLLAFAGTRTQHRMAVRIEDAGFEIRDMIAWVYGSGFPKSLDVSKAIDKAAGAEREVVGVSSVTGARHSRTMDDGNKGNRRTYQNEEPVINTITAPATDAARQWQGWGTALKPAMEPITVARKPLIGTVAANVLEHGAGAINVDGCRVETDGEKPAGSGNRLGVGNAYQLKDYVSTNGGNQTHESGRWPANLIHDGSEEVVELLGSAARFFYCAKASKRDRDEGLEGMPVRSEAWFQTGNGASGKPSSIEVSKGPRAPRANNHPTVKPTDLMRYLCRLVTPPNGTILDPFTGSGSTGKAAMLEGFQFIGIEREAEYVEIAKARIEAAKK
jgi:site-specific DNA-methyltransferase (adenine-specific)